MTISPLEDLTRWYLDDEAEMGEGRVQTAIIRLLLSCLRDLAEERGWSDYVIDSDQYIAWMESDPNVRVAPDVYLLWHPPEDPWVESWQTWRPDHPTPVFALEVVSYDWHKDYVLAPEKYGSLGVDELIVFDPKPHTRPRGRGTPFQLYRRTAQGVLQRQPADRGAWSATFGVFFVAVETEERVRVRLATSVDPLVLLPTPAERSKEEAERSKEEAERSKEDTEETRRENERLMALLRQHGIDPTTD